MTDYPYDPDLPFAVVSTNSEKVYARFRFRGSAENYVEGSTRERVIDTTPRPRIPDDAEFIYWQTEGGTPYYARWVGAQMVWTLDTGEQYITDGLLNRIGNAEIIVLDRRKEGA